MGALSAVFSFKDSATDAEREFKLNQQFVSPVTDRETSLNSLKNERRQNRQSIINSGKLLAGLRLDLIADQRVKDPGAEWRSLLKKAALSDQITREMMIVSQSDRCNSPGNNMDLPNELGALVQVAAMDDDEYRCGLYIGHINERSGTSSLKNFRKTYRRVGNDSLRKSYDTWFRQLPYGSNSNDKEFPLPKETTEATTQKSFGSIKFDIAKLDTKEKYQKAATDFRAAVGKINGVMWVKEPDAKSIDNLYTDSKATSAAKAKESADKFIKMVETLVAGGTEREDAIKAIKAPGKASLEKLSEDHAIFGMLEDPRKSFDAMVTRMKTREELIEAMNEEIERGEEWEKA